MAAGEACGSLCYVYAAPHRNFQKIFVILQTLTRVSKYARKALLIVSLFVISAKFQSGGRSKLLSLVVYAIIKGIPSGVRQSPLDPFLIGTPKTTNRRT